MTSPTGKSLRPLYRRESTAEKETVDAHLLRELCQHQDASIPNEDRDHTPYSRR
jgi:hypothetical protein